MLFLNVLFVNVMLCPALSNSYKCTSSLHFISSTQLHFNICLLDCNYSVWRKAVQLFSSGPGEVDVVCFPWAGRAGLGTGNTVQYPFKSF